MLLHHPCTVSASPMDLITVSMHRLYFLEEHRFQTTSFRSHLYLLIFLKSSLFCFVTAWLVLSKTSGGGNAGVCGRALSVFWHSTAFISLFLFPYYSSRFFFFKCRFMYSLQCNRPTRNGSAPRQSRTFGKKPTYWRSPSAIHSLGILYCWI